MLPELRLMRRLMGDGDWIWRDARVIAVDFEVDAKVAARWLPAALSPAKPAVATVFVADYPWTSFGSVYREAAILLHVRMGIIKAVHCPWMVVDDDRALILGREMLGFPKKIAAIDLKVDKESVFAGVERRGSKLIEIKGRLKEADYEPPPLFARRIINVWGSMGMTWMKLLTLKPREEILDAKHVVIDVQINGSEFDPLAELRFGRILSARLYKLNFGGGRLLPMPIMPLTQLYNLKQWALRFS